LFFKGLAAAMAKYEKDPIFKSQPFSDDYDIQWQRNLGSGISGPVRLCTHRESGKQYALKVLLDRPKARKEVTLHWLCSGSEYIVRAIDVYVNEIQLPGDSVAKKRILLVMELMDGGELFEYITQKQHFTEQEASQILRQITLAVQYCHCRNIAHRDLKPENLLLLRKAEDQKQIRVKLADFGFAKVDNGDLTTPQFTPYYVAPQVLEAQKRQKEIRAGQRSPSSPYYYDKSCDMWSIGVILYIMLCGYPPFYSEVPNQPITQRMRRKIMAGNFDFPQREWEKISDDAKDLVRHLLCVEENERISVDDLLRHRWLVHINVPPHDLPSPSILLDRDTLEQAKAAHSEFLQDMRREENGFYLKPISKSQNKLLTNRKASGATSPVRVVEKGVANDILSLKELQDICVMPSPLAVGAMETYADSSLVESVKKAVTFNEANAALKAALSSETWDLERNEFTGKVNRKRLAENLQKVIETVSERPMVMVT
jgi:mitogen-activated protein kinase-activated protein kinase 5